MASKTIYVAVKNNEILKASTSLKRFVGVSLFGKDYFYFYRKLKNSNGFDHTCDGELIKIVRTYAD